MLQASGHSQGGADGREDQDRGGQRYGPGAPPGVPAVPARLRLGAQVQRGRLSGDLVRRLAEGGTELVVQRSHDVLSSRWPSAFSARWVADLTVPGRMPITRAISGSGRSR